MGRRSFSREFKLEAVRLVRERGVSVAQAARDLDLHANMLRNWVREFAADPARRPKQKPPTTPAWRARRTRRLTQTKQPPRKSGQFRSWRERANRKLCDVCGQLIARWVSGIRRPVFQFLRKGPRPQLTA